MLDDVDWKVAAEVLARLRELVENGQPEVTRLDYKQTVYADSDSGKDDLRIDVSALANTAGGFIVLGIAAQNGYPTSFVGLKGVDLDAEVLRMQAILRARVEPPITGVEFAPIRDGDQPMAIVIRVPRSWRAPHRVVVKGLPRFYGRGANDNYLLSMEELRDLFVLSETIPDRIRRFREERLALIVSGRAPAPIRGDALIIWHAIPLGALGAPLPLNIEAIASWPDALVDLCGGSHRIRRNIDGLLCLAPDQCYAQLFRNGIVEVVAAQEPWIIKEALVAKIPRLDIAAFTEQILAYAGRSKLIARTIQAPLPLAMSITLSGMNGWQLWTQNLRPSLTMVDLGFDRDVVTVPDHLIETMDQDDDDHDAKPILDMIWQAAGWPEAKGFDENGKWTGRL